MKKTERLEIRMTENERHELNFLCIMSGLNKTDLVLLGLKKIREDLENGQRNKG